MKGGRERKQGAERERQTEKHHLVVSLIYTFISVCLKLLPVYSFRNAMLLF